VSIDHDLSQADAQRPSKARLALFAFGDFGFNLYWQSVMLFLLFYYTDTLGFGIGWAAATYMVASIWDGIIGFIIGIEADWRGRASNYRRALIWGAVPLGLAFVLAYLPLGGTKQWSLALLFAAHMLFRTFYAWVNVPYLAMTARISGDSRDRSFVAGLRMIFGTLAAIVVSLFTIDIGEALLGSASDAYLGGAIVFAVVASLILIGVGTTYRDMPTLAPAAPIPIGQLLLSLVRNRSFVMLSLAMVTMIIAVTMVGKSVLYYFKYFIHDEAAGRLALAQMMATGLVAIPAWMLVARLFSVRIVWIAAVSASVLLLVLFSLVDMDSAGIMQAFLVVFQAAVIGLNFAVWALLPDSIDYGEATTGKRVEAAVFGLASLLQRIAIGVATGLLGWGYFEAGFQPNTELAVGTLAKIRTLISIGPIALFILSGLAIALAPGLGTNDKQPIGPMGAD
jgi:Na+/melibiose symporter-like transporter